MTDIDVAGSTKSRDEQGRREAILPGAFLKGLRALLESGMLAEQAAALVSMTVGLREAADLFDEGELEGRVQEIVRVMEGDIRLTKQVRQAVAAAGQAEEDAEHQVAEESEER